MTERIPRASRVNTVEKLNDIYATGTFRIILEELLNYSPDLIDGIADIKIVQRSDQLPEGHDCFRYLFGNADVSQVMEDIFTNYTLYKNPVPDSYAVYTTDGGYPIHIGNVNESGNIISKWNGNGHVYEHKPLRTPDNYGNNIGFYLRVDKT